MAEVCTVLKKLTMHVEACNTFMLYYFKDSRPNRAIPVGAVVSCMLHNTTDLRYTLYRTVRSEVTVYTNKLRSIEYEVMT